MKFVRPYILFQALFILPFEGDIRSTGLWLLGYVYRNDTQLILGYVILVTLLAVSTDIYISHYLSIYMAITLRSNIKNKSWR